MKHTPAKIIPRERALQSAICAALKLMLPPDARCFAIPGGDRQVTLTPGYVPGTPDLIVIWRGRAIWMEVKREGEYLRPEQREIHAEIKECGCSVIVVRSLDDALAVLRNEGLPIKEMRA